MWWLALCALEAVTPTPAPEVAARVDDVTILMREIDARSQAKLAKLHAQLQELVAATVDRLIDEQVCAGTHDTEAPTPLPITADAIQDFQQAHRNDFTSNVAPAAAQNPAVAHKAIRHHLERQARAAAAAAACRRRRQAHAVEYIPADDNALDAPLPLTQALARIDGTPLLAGDVERVAALRLYRLRGEIFRERQRNLDVAVDEVLLAREATRRNTSRAALEAELASPRPVTEAELDAFLDSERAKGRPVPARDRARPYLEFQQAHARRATELARLRAAAHIEVLLVESVVPQLPIEDQDAPALGPATGRRLIVYSNYRCRPCRATHRELDRLRSSDPSVRVVLRDFVPVYDPVATEAALLARCAATLGVLPAMREILLSRDPPAFGTQWYSEAALPELARTIGVDPGEFAACAADPSLLAQIDSDTAGGRALGFDEAPAFVAEGIPLSGMQSAEGLAQALRDGSAHDR